MFQKNSRYQQCIPFKNETSVQTGFKGIRPRSPGKATPALEHILKEGERLDLLARHYYNEPQKWWRILDANPDILYAGDLSLNPGDFSSPERNGGENKPIQTAILIPKAEEQD